MSFNILFLKQEFPYNAGMILNGWTKVNIKRRFVLAGLVLDQFVPVRYEKLEFFRPDRHSLFHRVELEDEKVT